MTSVGPSNAWYSISRIFCRDLRRPTDPGSFTGLATFACHADDRAARAAHDQAPPPTPCGKGGSGAERYLGRLVLDATVSDDQLRAQIYQKVSPNELEGAVAEADRISDGLTCRSWRPHVTAVDRSVPLRMAR